VSVKNEIYAATTSFSSTKFLTLLSRPPPRRASRPQRFTEKAIKVVMLAQEEARRLGHNFVGTEQVRSRPSRRAARARPRGSRAPPSSSSSFA
jgi:hypothetical protein